MPSKRNKSKDIPKILALVEGGEGVTNACKEVGVSDRTFLRWRQKDPDIDDQLKEAEKKRDRCRKRQLVDRLFEIAMQRPSAPHTVKALHIYLRKLDPDFRENIVINKTITPDEYKEMIQGLMKESKE
jgi:hypothetical protein